jgi:protein SCO1/2
MNKKSIFYIIFFSALVLVFYFIITLIIPGFGKKNFPPIGRVQRFAFINQDGKPVTEKDVEGRVFVAEFFFTTCKGICPRMNMNMRTVYEKFKDESCFLILSHTSDPKTDSAAQLKKYSDSLGVSGKNWIFLTGRKDSLYNMARYSYKIDDPNNSLKNTEEDFLHSQFFALVNKKGEVKKIYDGLKPSEIDAMMLEIETLLKEK